jgi:hypothetical protein
VVFEKFLGVHGASPVGNHQAFKINVLILIVLTIKRSNRFNYPKITMALWQD